VEVYRLANIKSAKKRILVAETKAARNKAIRSKVKTYVKKVEAAITAGDKAAAEAAYKVAAQKLDKAAGAGVIHKNQAANRKSGLAVAINAL
jgi:small subunit ribosomal protein S20